MKSLYLIKVIMILFLVAATKSIYGQAKEIKVNYTEPGIIEMAAFKLTADTRVKLSGKGALLHGFNDHRRNSWNNDLLVYGWIIDSDTRNVVWSLKDVIRSGDKKPKGIFSFDEEKNLKPGEYEVYYTAMFDFDDDRISSRKGNWWKQVFNSDRDYYDRHDLEGLGLTVSGPSASFSETNVEGVVDRHNSRALVNFIRTGDDKSYSKGFTLNGDTKLKIYSIGEANYNSSYDYAWIYDVKKNKRVWTLNDKVYKPAGGAEKNVLFNGEITLPKGTYTVNYTTDDSHSFEEWNSLPPDDPQFWGITMWASTENDLKNITDYQQTDEVKPVLEMIKVGDDESRSQGFRLNKDTKLRVLCIGEGVGDGMADYGYIIDADTRKTVWEMDEDNTEHAGGADKNRMIDEEITLKKGNYIAYYSTDDSHSYFDWNAEPPYDKERWGLTIWTVNESDRSAFSLFDEKEYKSADVAAEIVRVKDNDFESKEFTLDKDTKLRVYSIGEGVRGSMADYGWIEEDTSGKTVWEMTYKKTKHAGGADKNRVADEVISLPKGKYRIYYETDGSHSYKDWNSAPPDDQERYGITLTYVK